MDVVFSLFIVTGTYLLLKKFQIGLIRVINQLYNRTKNLF